MLPAILFESIGAISSSSSATVFIAVLFQELSRALFVKLYFYAENALIRKTEIIESPFNDWSMAISAGM